MYMDILGQMSEMSVYCGPNPRKFHNRDTMLEDVLKVDITKNEGGKSLFTSTALKLIQAFHNLCDTCKT